MRGKVTILRIALAIVAIIIIGFVSLVGILSIRFSSNVTMAWTPQLTTFIASVAITALVALYIISKFFGLLRLITMQLVFTQASVAIFRQIRIATLVAAITMLGSLPAVYTWADGEDAPGLMLIGLGIAFIPFAIYAAFAVMEQVLKNAVQSQQHPVHS